MSEKQPIGGVEPTRPFPPPPPPPKKDQDVVWYRHLSESMVFRDHRTPGKLTCELRVRQTKSQTFVLEAGVGLMDAKRWEDVSEHWLSWGFVNELLKDLLIRTVSRRDAPPEPEKQSETAKDLPRVIWQAKCSDWGEYRVVRLPADRRGEHLIPEKRCPDDAMGNEAWGYAAWAGGWGQVLIDSLLAKLESPG